MIASTRRKLLQTALAGGVALPGAALTGAALAAPPNAATYKPQTRDLVLTLVPLLVNEQQNLYPFLKEDFAKGGLLAGKEVYGFVPGGVFAYAGDTVRFHIYNPTDDVHTLTFPELTQSVTLLGKTDNHLTLEAVKPGIYRFECLEPEHYPFMWGELLVLPAPQ